MKTWKEATMEVLEISSTAGGAIFNTTQDGDAWYDGRHWNIPTGEDPISR